MRKPYLIAKHNPEAEYKALEAKAKMAKPLEFLEQIRVNDGWADECQAFDIAPQLEFILMEESLIPKIKTALIEFGFDVSITDVSDKLLHGNIDMTNASEKIKKEINAYYLDAYDANDILDKISNIGLESLNEMDKSILNGNTL